MVVLSVCDGISCLQLALHRAGIKYSKYFSSEIEKRSIGVTQHWFPDTIQIGDLYKVHYKDGVLYTENGNYSVGKIDLLAGGTPCQSISLVARDRKDLRGKSSLFFEFYRLLKEINPTYFLLENVRPSNKVKKIIDGCMGVEGVLIDSALVSYQMRKRLYWTNIKFFPIEDKHISFQDYKDMEYDKSLIINHTPYNDEIIYGSWNGRDYSKGKRYCNVIDKQDKLHCILVSGLSLSNVVKIGDWVRKLTRKEMELAQTLPIGYTNILTYTQARQVIGNGWTVDVIAHILSGIKEDNMVSWR